MRMSITCILDSISRIGLSHQAGVEGQNLYTHREEMQNVFIIYAENLEEGDHL